MFWWNYCTTIEREYSQEERKNKRKRQRDSRKSCADVGLSNIRRSLAHKRPSNSQTHWGQANGPAMNKRPASLFLFFFSFQTSWAFVFGAPYTNCYLLNRSLHIHLFWPIKKRISSEGGGTDKVFIYLLNSIPQVKSLENPASFLIS